MSTQTLYRFWRGDDLLYIGISINAYERAAQHKLAASWWEEADRVTFERHPDRPSVLAEERAAIRAEQPKYNIQHSHPAPVMGGNMTTGTGAPRLLKPEDVAARLGITLQTLYRWRSEGKDMPKGFLVGSRVRWRQSTVDAWVAATALKVAA